MINTRMFAGVAPQGLDKSLNLFKEIYNDDGRIYLETAHTYQHVEDGLIFEYKYVLSITDYSTWMDSINPDFPYFAELYLIPTPESLDKGVLKELAECNGIEQDEVTIYDLIIEGDSVMLGATEGLYQIMDANAGKMKDNEVYEGFTEEDIPELINLVSNVIDAIDMVRGFYLDRVFNGIGWNGWDVIQKLVNGQELNFFTKLSKNTEDES